MTLLEAYKNRLAISESVYSRSHNGEKLDNAKKIATAQCLKNVDSFLNEAFDNSVGTQRSDMGLYKKFCLNLTTVALPNLIAHELVIVKPMTSMSGYVTYIEYTAATNKGATAQGKFLNSPFALGDVDETYTSDRVVESLTAGTGAQVLAWTPVVKGVFEGKDVKITHADGSTPTLVYYNTADNKFYTSFDGTTYSSQYTVIAGDKAAYVYDNVIIPQNDIPQIKAEIKNIPLIAKARRIAIYYSQMAAYQATTDYGVSLGDQLAEKAVGELSYEIDTEVTQLLIDNAAHATELDWSKTLPVGVSKSEHYEGFSEVLEIAKQKIYDATKKFVPNYMLIASNILPVLTFIKGFQAAPTGNMSGPYFAGTLNGFKVFVTPNIEAGHYVIGVNGNDLMSSAAVYAPYMAIVPTQLLQYADGATSQGFSTLYDLKILNANLLVSGIVTD